MGETCSNVRGFTDVPFKLQGSRVVRHMYYKLHQLRGNLNDSMPAGRTLFVLCVPPFCNQDNMSKLFSFLGPVEKVVFQQTPTIACSVDATFDKSQQIKGYKVAYIIFKEIKSTKAALSFKYNNPLILSTQNTATGISKWCLEYNNSVLGAESLQSEIDNFMETFDTNVENKMQQEKETVGVPDAEGWITVTRQGKKAGMARTQNNETRVIERENKKKPRKELQNFYTFQIRESKMEHIVQLRKKFEDDKRRISLMKMARKFRPY